MDPQAASLEVTLNTIETDTWTDRLQGEEESGVLLNEAQSPQTTQCWNQPRATSTRNSEVVEKEKLAGILKRLFSSTKELISFRRRLNSFPTVQRSDGYTAACIILIFICADARTKPESVKDLLYVLGASQ